MYSCAVIELKLEATPVDTSPRRRRRDGAPDRLRSTQAKKSSGGSKKRKSEAISEEEPAAEAAGGDDAMDMTAVNKLTADKLKKELKKRKLDDKGKKAELKARLVEALGL